MDAPEALQVYRAPQHVRLIDGSVVVRMQLISRALRRVVYATPATDWNLANQMVDRYLAKHDHLVDVTIRIRYEAV